MPHNPLQQAMFILSGDPETESVSSLYAPGQLGQRVTRIDDDGYAKQYQLVRTDSTMTTAPYEGAVAVWSDQANYVVTTAVTGRGLPAGVFRCAWQAAGDYMFVQTKGPCPTVKYVDTPTAEPGANGQFVIVSGTAAKADCIAAGTATTYPSIGRSTSVREPITSVGSVDLDVPETN